MGYIKTTQYTPIPEGVEVGDENYTSLISNVRKSFNNASEAVEAHAAFNDMGSITVTATMTVED